MFPEFVEALQRRIHKPLPGFAAQKRMAPAITRSDRFILSTKGNAKPGGVLLLLYPHNDKIWFPLMQRPTYDGAHSGQVSLPGGKQEPVDKDRIQTAIREAQEEIGIDPGSIEIIGQLTELFIPASNYMVLPVVGFTTQKPAFVPEPREVEEVIEASLEEFMDREKHKRKDIIVRGNVRLDAPYFEIDGKVVWGATAMILSEFYLILDEIGGSGRLFF